MLEASIERGDVRHKASMLLMDNAVLVLFYEEPMRIGPLSFSTPGIREGGATTSSVLLGGKYLIAARALAERAAALFNRMSLVSLNTRLNKAAARSARARAAIRYLPPRSTLEVVAPPSLSPGVENASVPILIGSS